MHFKLNWSSPDSLILCSCVCGLGVDCTTISKERLIIEVVVLAVRIASFQSTSIIEQSLIVHQILIGRLSLSQGNFFTDISFLFFNLLLSFCTDFLHSLFSFDFPHAMISKFLSLAKLLIFVFIIFVFLNSFHVLFRLHRQSSHLLLFLQILLVIHTSLNLCSFLKLKLRLTLCNVE